MEKVKVVSNIPMKLPISQTILYTFLMDYYNASELAWGVFISLGIIMWIGVIAFLIKQERIDIFKEEKQEEIKETVTEESKFQQKMREMQERY